MATERSILINGSKKEVCEEDFEKARKRKIFSPEILGVGGNMRFSAKYYAVFQP